MEPTHELKKGEAGIGPMVGIAVVVILLAVGAIYFFAQESAKFNNPDQVGSA
ncbi:MAG: hypothetical protein KGI70_00490 [Patescibacteria group bacterium]|nr:hypothetical protein [Patescibacteria group bacterium]